MTRILITTLVLLLGGCSTCHAQSAAPGAATHLWVESGTNVIYVPSKSLEACLTLVRQSAYLNSAEGHCYNGDQFLQRIECRKAVKKGQAPECKTGGGPSD